METTAYIALSRQMILRQRMEVIAHNIANAASTGFKAHALMLEPVIADAGQRTRLAFVQDVATVRDVAPGPMITTNNPLDLAIDGPGYFVFETAAGRRYGRSGQFQLNEQGELVNAAGEPVLDDGGAPLALPEGASDIVVSADGTLSSQQGVIGRLDLVTFADEQMLRPVGGGLYASAQPPAPAEAARLVQGALEGSNVQPIVEMTDMMTTVRAYQSTQQLIDTHHELQRRAIERMLQATT